MESATRECNRRSVAFARSSAISMRAPPRSQVALHRTAAFSRARDGCAIQPAPPPAIQRADCYRAEERISGAALPGVLHRAIRVRRAHRRGSRLCWDQAEAAGSMAIRGQRDAVVPKTARTRARTAAAAARCCRPHSLPGKPQRIAAPALPSRLRCPWRRLAGRAGMPTSATDALRQEWSCCHRLRRPQHQHCPCPCCCSHRRTPSPARWCRGPSHGHLCAARRDSTARRLR